jgi:tetraacyldisaccharide 4'-kinase
MADAQLLNNRAVRLLLTPFSWLYSGVMRLRNLGFDTGLIVSEKAAVPVISIGNITAGGSGKTPLVIALAEWFTRAGIKVAVVSRGYGRSSKGAMIVSDAKGKLASCANGGDEPVLIARRVPEAVVIVSEKRAAGARIARQQFGVDLIILDDAFQHRYLKRDCDIVLLDANKPLDREKVLPAGLLREPLSQISRADIVVMTRLKPGQTAQRPQWLPAEADLPHFPAVMQTSRLVDDQFNECGELSDLAGQSIVLVTGIADAGPLKAYLAQQGVEIIRHFDFSDHYRYSAADLQKLAQVCSGTGVNRVITTEKDLVKLAELDRTGLVIQAIRMDALLPEIFYEKVSSHLDLELNC